MTNFSFPPLPVSEILGPLQLFGVQFTEDDINKPQPDNIRKAYERILTTLTGYRKEDNQQQFKFSAVKLLTNPEMHDESTLEITFIRLFTKFIRAIGIHDFGAKDIYTPQPARVKRILSGVINLAVFREYKIPKYQELLKRSEDIRSERDQIYQETEALKIQLDNLRYAYATYFACLHEKEERDRIENELNGDVHTLQTQLDILNKTQAELNQVCNELKENAEELGHKIEDQKFNISALNQEIGRVETLIVRSPDRMKRVIEDMETTLAAEKESLSNMESINGKTQLTLATVDNILKDVRKTSNLITKSESENAQFKQVKHTGKDTQKKISDQQKLLRELESKIMLTEKKIINENETMASAQERFKKYKEQCQTSITEAENENKTLRKEMGENEEKCIEISRAILEIQTKLEDDIRVNAEIKRTLIQRHNSLVHCIQSFHQDLLNTLSSPIQPSTK
ncbi:hypothetical protein DFA_03797 [Cavenderia fasciculata]|uniref:Kinetochore protein Nuf2 n=1 Tax=Cavenderia fasciculata TaxID=261658 RepID=F4Q0F2_CACFS|nr:uncharacterized protein DFA_03797 [Cavenderia fasciculata]EGG18303.1 hypothetical protein DFA_03797 [Cavenderia fasciculata]|eukprot:XP_004357126.1 hypothetical protein DFA_03797 [Cavenderia fasciculata]